MLIMANYDKKYIGKAKIEANKWGVEELSFYINMEQAKDHTKYMMDGAEMLFAKISKMQSPDKKGYTHTVYVLEKKENV